MHGKFVVQELLRVKMTGMQVHGEDVREGKEHCRFGVAGEDILDLKAVGVLLGTE